MYTKVIEYYIHNIKHNYTMNRQLFIQWKIKRPRKGPQLQPVGIHQGFPRDLGERLCQRAIVR